LSSPQRATAREPALSIAICTRDRPGPLERCLASVRPQLDGQAELLVIDSAPRGEGVGALAAAFGARYAFVSRPGLNVARNVALRGADSPWVAYLDDDVVVAPGWLAALRRSLDDRSVACVTGRVLPLELHTPAQRYFEQQFSFDRGSEPIRFTAGDEREWFPINPYHLGTGCNMALRREALDGIGPFDEALDVGTPTGGGGDLDLFRRLLCAGFAAAYNPDAVVYHDHRASMAELRRQFWGYGKAASAILAKSLLVEREMQGEAWRLFTYRLRRQGRAVARRLVKGRGLPLSLILSETAGNLAGPVAYLYSLWWLRQQRARERKRRHGGFGLGLDEAPPARYESREKQGI
jgi:GT2 family glycosyltransferase